MKAFLVLFMVLVSGLGQASAINLSPRASGHDAEVGLLVSDGGQAYPIQPSDAALIAQRSVPDSRVLNVQLLPSGEYAVTLKSGGSVQKVMVNASSGAIS